MKNSSVLVDNIGNRIREIRKQKQISQKEFALKVGCAPNTVAEWEKRQGRAPGKILLGKVAEVLEVTTDFLLGVENESYEIPCYGEVNSDSFYLEKNSFKYKVSIPPSKYKESLFCIKVLDELLMPIIQKSDYAIFETVLPKDGDIAVVFWEEKNFYMIKRWRQDRNYIMLSETNLKNVRKPYFFISKKTKNRKFFTNSSTLEVLGVLTGVKKNMIISNSYPKIDYIYTGLS